MKTRVPHDVAAARSARKPRPPIPAAMGTAGWAQAQADRARVRSVLRAPPEWAARETASATGATAEPGPDAGRSAEPALLDAATDASAGRVAMLVDAMPGPAQMTKEAWLAELRAAIIEGANEDLARDGWTADGCPWIDYWLSYYAGRSARDVEAALHRFAPATRDARSAHDYIGLAVARVRAAIQRWHHSGTIEPPFDAVAPDALGPEALRARMGPGRPLDGDVRTRMEHGFGRDLSDVRVHTEPPAVAVAQQHAASAITIGTNIGFGAEQYRPGTLIGDLLIAHEIAHAVQQSAATIYAPTSDSRPDEAHADLAAGTAVARIAGVNVPRPASRSSRGLALRRCSVVPREFDDEHQFEDQQGGELKQAAWLRRFRHDHPTLENIVLDPGPRDTGNDTPAGIRVPRVQGNLLAPRPYYEHRYAAFFAYQGAIHFAELIENQQFKAAFAIANAAHDKYGDIAVHDTHLDIEAYYRWVYIAKQSVDNLQTALMIVEGGRGVRDAIRNRPPKPRGTTGEINRPPAPPVAEPKVEPKVIVDPTLTEPVPPVGAKPPPAPTATKPAPTVGVEPPPAPTAAKPPPAGTEPAPTTGAKPAEPVKAGAGGALEKRGYEGEWPPPEPGPRPKNATPDEMADWRYKRYLRDAYKEGKSPAELLKPEAYKKPYGTIAEEGGRPGRGGGQAQKDVRNGPAKDAGYDNVENVQLGTRTDPKTGKPEANMVDGLKPKPNANGGRDYLEVDTINKNGLPKAELRTKLKSEIEAMKPGDTLEYWDKNDPSRRIRYEYGDPPSVVDTQRAPTVPRAPRTPKPPPPTDPPK